MSAVKKGNDYRDTIARILAAASYRNVEIEKRLGGYKKVDVYYERFEYGSLVRYAIEAKNYEKPLTKAYIASNIFSEYSVLLNNKEVDKVIIIAPLDVSPDTRKYIIGCGFMFMTLEQFRSHIMNFLTYLEGLCTGYKEGGLDKYYMPLYFGENQSLKERLLSWISEENARPIAILAGYGMGKTSFSKHFACALAEEFLENNRGRIPIYIRLGEISDEQSLEGLLAKSLISSNAVQNYTFELFMELNRSGQFCILLDGFDEMKHAMTWDQFRHNVKELNRLVEKRSKVILLGRPSAFISDSEQALILRGVRPLDEKEVRAFEWSIYDRIELNFFTREASIEFMGKYIRHLVTDSGIDCNMPLEEFISKRIIEIKALDFSEIILRPVQAKMLAEIASEPSQQLESYSRYGLYKHFMDCIIEREMFKKSRRIFSSDTRRNFVRELAWWMWCDGGGSGLALSEIPRSLIDKCRDGKNIDREAALRDLVSGSVLETKMADKFYFPHRSYQEFLVSEYIIGLTPDLGAIERVKGAINGEIKDFVMESGNKNAFNALYEIVPEYKGTLSLQFIELLAWAAPNDISAKDISSEWHLIVGFYQRLAEFGPDEAGEFILEILKVTETREIVLTALLCLCMSILYSERKNTKLGMTLATVILKSALPVIEKIVNAKKKSPIAMQAGIGGAWHEIVLRAFAVNDFSYGLNLDVNVNEVFESIKASLSLKLRVSGVPDFEPFNYIVTLQGLSTTEEDLSMNNKGGVVAKYFRDYHRNQKMIPVTVMRKPADRKLPGWAR
ncbi:hypothetical protein CH92_00905 [Stutzerimonas stutzeri]|uniref:NACHT domain-containing protein n=1 Tax=Stutzerimonas stutzeri TaxID=316 RepID=W8RGG1_STUST|nr:NACHT domain-containing protein [Stutzerimonas stutzeri]AHL77597.1 hypothetical protein CH92_00905 [Stutzerimonas stutzeri]MCQ4328755.1 NACHT domain-containing protein [Stutzerimonas stutzeri]